MPVLGREDCGSSSTLSLTCRTSLLLGESAYKNLQIDSDGRGQLLNDNKLYEKGQRHL